MAKFRVAFAAKAKDIGKLVEMDEREAAELVKFGRLVRVPEKPVVVEAAVAEPEAVAAESAGRTGKPK